MNFIEKLALKFLDNYKDEIIGIAVTELGKMYVQNRSAFFKALNDIVKNTPLVDTASLAEITKLQKDIELWFAAPQFLAIVDDLKAMAKK